MKKKIKRINDKPFQIYLNDDLMKKLQKLKNSTHVPMATQVRLWVEEKLKEQK